MLNRIKRLAGVALAIAVLFPVANTVAAESNTGAITVTDPWARATPPRARTGAAYMMLKNTGAEVDRLTGVTSAVADRTEIHRSRIENGIMTMGQVKILEVPAGGMAMLKPGGLHVMFMGLKRQLKVGESFPLTLVFDKAGPVHITVPVQKSGGKQPPHKHH